MIVTVGPNHSGIVSMNR